MQPKPNVFDTLQAAVKALDAAIADDAAAPIRPGLIAQRDVLRAMIDTLSRCNIDTVQGIKGARP
jgi:hypothetical protein